MIRKILTLFLFLAYTFSYSNQIVYPWRATSAIVEAGGSFNILFNNRSFLPIDSVTIASEYFSTRLNLNSVEINKIEYDPQTKLYANNIINVNVPHGVPVDIYDLIVHIDGERIKSRKSIKIISKFRKTQKVLHISDLHISRNWKGDSLNGYAEELELFDKFVDVANLIDPDYIIITGDNIMDYTRFDPDSIGWGGVRNYNSHSRPHLEEKYKNLFFGANGFRGLFGLESPFFLTTGNHDFYGIPEDAFFEKRMQWNEMCGLRVFGFSYGNSRILIHDDSLGDTEENDLSYNQDSAGIQGELLEKYLFKNGPGNVRILAQHHHDIVDTAFLRRNNINILLNGHSHRPNIDKIKINDNDSTVVIRSGVVCRSGELGNWEENLGYFRILTIEDNGNFEYTSPLRFCSNPFAEYDSIELNLSSQFKFNNDGTWSNNAVLVKNDLNVDLFKCKVRFIMKEGDYMAEGGDIYQIINKDEYTIVDVYVDVEANSVKNVEVFSR